MNASYPNVYVALLGWFFVVPAFFLLLPPRRAIIAAFLGAWLFLPVGGIAIGGLPNVDKMWMTSVGALVGVLMFDAGKLFAFRPRWYDLAIVGLCASPFFSSISNGLGVYDGLSYSFEKCVNWGLPYLFGRIYFNNLRALRELAIGILIGGLIYVPLSLYEVRMSPQLHRMVYGYFPHVWAQTKRFDGWRPQVFMPHGLALGFWLAAATLVCLWLWQSRSVRMIARIPMWVWLIPLVITTILCKSVNGWAVLAIGVAALPFLIARRPILPRRLVMVAVIAIAPTYMFVRTTKLWQGEVAVPFVATFIHPDRARSLEYRLEAEELLIERAMQRPIFGWGGWGRHRVINERGYDIATTDGQWIIQFGKHGLFGLCTWAAVLLLPPWLLARRLPPEVWPSPLAAPSIVLAVILALYAVDSLLNAMPNPLFVLTTGGLAACHLTARDRVLIAAAARPPRAAAPAAENGPFMGDVVWTPMNPETGRPSRRLESLAAASADDSLPSLRRNHLLGRFRTSRVDPEIVLAGGPDASVAGDTGAAQARFLARRRRLLEQEMIAAAALAAESGARTTDTDGSPPVPTNRLARPAAPKDDASHD